MRTIASPFGFAGAKVRRISETAKLLSDIFLKKMAMGRNWLLFTDNHASAGLMSGKNKNFGYLNVFGSIGCIDGYIGNQVAVEIEYAESLGKEVIYHSKYASTEA